MQKSPEYFDCWEELMIQFAVHTSQSIPMNFFSESVLSESGLLTASLAAGGVGLFDESVPGDISSTALDIFVATTSQPPRQDKRATCTCMRITSSAFRVSITVERNR